MDNLSKSYLLTDYKILRQIQRRKYRRLTSPILAICLSLIITFLLRNLDYMYFPLLTITVASFVWYGYIMVSFRTKGRIVQPERGMMVSPIEGRIKSLRSGGEVHSIRISKAFIDVIEIRCPFPGEYTREGNNLTIMTDSESIHLLFHGKDITWIDAGFSWGAEGKRPYIFHSKDITWIDAGGSEKSAGGKHSYDDAVAGSVIGFMVGKGSCTINLPAVYTPEVTIAQIVFGGESVICPFTPVVS